MKQTVIVGKPPVYDRCVAAFGADVIIGKPILWSWGDKIYNPEDIDIPKELLAHEAVHGSRQSSDPARILQWWDHYLMNERFRFEEERLAHRAEWMYCARRYPGRRSLLALDAISTRLSSSLYGAMTDAAAARNEILHP